MCACGGPLRTVPATMRGVCCCLWWALLSCVGVLSKPIGTESERLCVRAVGFVRCACVDGERGERATEGPTNKNCSVNPRLPGSGYTTDKTTTRVTKLVPFCNAPCLLVGDKAAARRSRQLAAAAAAAATTAATEEVLLKHREGQTSFTRRTSSDRCVCVCVCVF
jgi:hypothetical protein